MKILYFSVHQVLEYDDLRVFRRLGYDVFSVGSYFRPEPNFPLRPRLDLGERHADFLRSFHAMGCIYDTSPMKCHLTAEFVELFDVVVVMHAVAAAARYWPALSVRPVIWRTIGQAIDEHETIAKPLREGGMYIVRYSPNEMLSDAYIGSDALIRFCKDPADFAPWDGSFRRVISFVNLFAQRYPADYARYQRIMDGLPQALGGLHNEGLVGAVGAVDAEQQLVMLRTSRAYLYASGGGIPYTLSFMEAWMAGIPVVVMDDRAERSRFDEVQVLLRDGENGFVARTEADARAVLTALLEDYGLAQRIGQAGRRAAEELFGWDTAMKQWQALLESTATAGRSS